MSIAYYFKKKWRWGWRWGSYVVYAEVCVQHLDDNHWATDDASQEEQNKEFVPKKYWEWRLFEYGAIWSWMCTGWLQPIRTFLCKAKSQFEPISKSFPDPGQHCYWNQHFPAAFVWVIYRAIFQEAKRTSPFDLPGLREKVVAVQSRLKIVKNASNQLLTVGMICL